MKGMDMIDSIRVWLAGRVIAWNTRRHIQLTEGLTLSITAKLIINVWKYIIHKLAFMYIDKYRCKFNLIFFVGIVSLISVILSTISLGQQNYMRFS